MWALLALVVVVRGAAGGRQRYSDIDTVKMPLYGSNDYEALHHSSDAAAAGVDADDYHSQSPDAPVSLDYKYEEELKENTEESSLKYKEVETADEWHKLAQNQRRRAETDNDDYSEIINKHSHDDIVPKFKSNRRFTKHRSRLKSKRSERDPYSRGINYHKDDNNEGRDVESEDEYNSNKEFQETGRHINDDIKYSLRKTTDRIVQRKPRDKERPIHMDDMQDLLIPDKRLKDDEGDMNFQRDMILGRQPVLDRHRSLVDDSDDPRYLFDLDRRRPGDSDSDDLRRVLGEERSRPHATNNNEPRPPQKRIRGKEKINSDEYDDFYDMKRVLDIKNKLPDLVRQTKARGAAPRPMQELEELPTNRRAFVPAKLTLSESMASLTTDLLTASIAISERPRVSSLATRTTTTTNTATTTIETKGELSMAEKSRLSILKKILKKESDRNGTPIRKPAVLLQVTKKLPTVVVVEPATKSKPWMRAREVAEDSPTRVERAKQLIRHKLIANAKNIQDLTDNWDETVCEYIDVSLLDQMSAAPRGLSHVVRLITAVHCIVTLWCL